MSLAPATAKELAAVFISRQLTNDDRVSMGANLPVPAAGCFLANLTHAPDLRIHALSYFINLAGAEKVEELSQVASPSLLKHSEAVFSQDQLFYYVPLMSINFFGALQIDRFGNSNLIGTGSDYRHLKFRGPGPVGTSGVGSSVKSFYLYVGSHSPRTFVDKLDFCSCVGWHNGGADARKKLGLIGGGPTYVISSKAVMDFEEETKRMRLLYLFPDVTVDDVVSNTGFELLIAPDVAVLPEPTEEELSVLRTRVDIKGVLRNTVAIHSS